MAKYYIFYSSYYWCMKIIKENIIIIISGLYVTISRRRFIE